MIRIGKNLFRERTFLIREQLVLAKEIKSINQDVAISKPSPNFDEISKIQKKIQEKERAITKLVNKYSLDKKIN